MGRLHRCYHCGFETDDKGLFLCNQGDGDTYWTQFSCPQCCLTNPPVAEVPVWSKDRPRFKDPKWEVSETGYGVYIYAIGHKGGKSGSPIIAKHPLYKAPASILREGLEGTIADHHKRLIVEGKRQSTVFHAEINAWQKLNPPPRSHTGEAWKVWQAKNIAFTDDSRERNRVGPHFQCVTHDGPTLMGLAGKTQRHVRVA